MDFLAMTRAAGLAAPVVPEDDPRWSQLRVAAAPGVDLGDRYRGALVGGAIGDAMGRPNEGVQASEAKARKIRKYQPWHGWPGGPTGTITDGTQMTMWLAESILVAARRGRDAGAEGLIVRRDVVALIALRASEVWELASMASPAWSGT